MSSITYPSARRDEDHAEVYQSSKNGDVSVKDPYHWLEIPTSESEETKTWVSAQVALTAEHLKLIPDRGAFRDQLANNWNYSKFSVPSLKKDGNFYVSYNTGLQNQSSIYRFPEANFDKYKTKEGPPGELFFDPNLLAADGTASLSTTGFSHTAKYWTYSVCKSGSDWSTVHVRSTSAPFVGVDDASKLVDELKHTKMSSFDWTHDDKGFFYERWALEDVKVGEVEDLGTATAVDRDAAVYYHRLGTPQSSDLLVHSNPAEPEWFWDGLIVTADGKHGILNTTKDGNNALVHICELGDGGKDGEGYQNLKFRTIFGEWGSKYHIFDNDGTKFFARTNKDAPNWKVVTFDLADEEITFKELIPEHPTAVLTSASVVRDDVLVVTYSRDVNSELYLYDKKTGKQIKRLMPNYVGSIGSISGRKEHERFFLSTSGYTNPGAVSVVDLSREKQTRPEDAEVELLKTTKIDLDANDFITVQEFYESKDGTRVPMFVTRHKDVKLDGSAPVFLQGYGGFAYSVTPQFSPASMTWVKSYRGVLAMPNVRGGGEYGENWHKGGIKENKQNCIDDFLCAAEHLIAKGYTSEGKIILHGGSNGGLLVSACTNQAREGLIGASIADVGIHDLLKFNRWTVGQYWIPEYGNPGKAEDFDFIYPISPLHNIVKDKVYPPFLICTADHDDRVVPAHSFKLVATLQHSLASNPHPFLIRIDVGAGHGVTTPTSKRIDLAVDKYTWASHALGLKMVSGED